jgi:carbamoyltransferase
MNIIGYSGLHHSIAFKQKEFPGLSPREYRISQGLDAAAALVTPAGILAAAAEERFTGVKGTNAFPAHAIEYCLQAARLNPADIDYVAHGFSYEPVKAAFEHTDFSQKQFNEVYAKKNQLALLQEFLPDYRWADKLVEVPHHLAHAASSYYVSGFDESLIVVTDGMGEIHSTTIAVGRGRDLEILKTVTAPHSLGILYGVVTLYLGFWMGFDEYKVMGLAPYGNPRRFFNQFMEFIQLHPDGACSTPILFRNATTLEKETYSGTLQILEDAFGPRRQPDEEITPHHMDIAAGLQAALQAGLMHTLRHFKQETGLRRLCLAGGVALNCTANGVIKRSRMFDDMFIQPAASDDGTALGAALYVQNTHAAPTPAKMSMPLWGPEYSGDDIAGAIAARSDIEALHVPDFVDLTAGIARRLAAGQVVAWFQGRMEYGPRALGNRSILADPRGPHMRDHINALVKKREGFRPFAPAVTAEAAADYFEIDPGDTSLFEYMLCVTPVKPAWRAELPAITHVDGSARAQIVTETGNPRFWHMLNAFKAETGLPILLNTSFNLRGQPIIRTPEIALETFAGSEIDVLVIGDYIITHRK